MIISFCGCADAGKSTVIKHFASQPIFKRKNLRIKGDDQFFLISIYKQIFGDVQSRKYNDRKQSIHSSSHKTIIDIIYPLVVYLEYLVDYFMYEIIFPAKILIKDRYIYDYLVTFHQNLGIQSPVINYLMINFPRPSLLYYLQVTPQTVMSRNKNYHPGLKSSTITFHRQVVNEYEQLAEKKKMLAVNNEGDLKETVRAVTTHYNNWQVLKSLPQISFSGLDGVGKTTLINYFSAYLCQLNIRYRVVHFYHDTLLYKFLKIFGYDSAAPSLDKKFMLKESAIRKKKGKTIYWAVASYLDALAQVFIFKIISFRKLLIYDRYFYDYLVTFPYYRVKPLPLFNVFPKFKYSFVLLCSPKVIYTRKFENLPEFYEKSHQRFLDFTRHYGLIPLDTEKYQPSQLLSQIITKLYGLQGN